MTEKSPKSPLSRRDFLRLTAAMGGTVSVSALLAACAKAGILPDVTPSPSATPPIPTRTREFTSTTTDVPETPPPTQTSTAPAPSPTETGLDGKARVAFVKTNHRANGVRTAIDLLGVHAVAGKSVFLKPNFNSPDPAPGSTHPDVLTALVTALKDMGARQITVGDRSGMGNTRQVMEQLGVFRLADELGFDALVLDELAAEDWVMLQPTGSHWGQGIPFARPCLEADMLVQTCCLKTHRFGGHFTLSLKNSVGMVAKRQAGMDHDFMDELHNSPHQRRMIAEINAAYTPALVVMDGVEAFVSGGPDTGEKVTPQVILAASDRVALDAVGIAILRYFGCKTEAGQGRIFEQEQIARAVELELGVDGPEKIEFVTGDADSAAYSEEIRALLMAG